MNSDEYQNLAEIETRHWFYSGKRDIVRYWLERVAPLQKQHLLVDVGAGTGKFVEEMSSRCKAIAVDDHAESLEIAQGRLKSEQVMEGRCTELPFTDGSVDVITALDVLEHVEEDRRAMEEFVRVLRPGGTIVITVPALTALWSDWDVALHHFRRYSKPMLRTLYSLPELEEVHCNYINVAALPAVWLVRKLRARKSSNFHNRMEDALPPEAINTFLRGLFVSFACQSVIHFPAGVGLLAVLKKRSDV